MALYNDLCEQLLGRRPLHRGRGPSELFEQFFFRGNVQYCCEGERYKRQGGKDVVNSSFLRFAKQKGLLAEDYTAYLNVKKTLESGYKSISKYDKPHPVFNEEQQSAWNLSYDWTKRHFMCMENSNIITSDEAITQLDKSTSCGFPWNLKYLKKKDFFQEEINREFLVSYWDELSREEPLWVPIWTCSQKDELRSRAKVEEKKHRTFLVSPVEHTVSLGRMCLDMNERFYANNFVTWSFVGGTKFDGMWERLYNKLVEKPNGFELDETDYDASLFAEAMTDMCRMRIEFLHPSHRTPANVKRMQNLYASIVHSTIILEDGQIVQKSGGNPSGSGNTIVDNTLILFRLLAYAFILLLSRTGDDPSYEDFMNLVRAFLNGDDNTLTVDDSIVGWFNATTIAAEWKKLGVVTKSDVWEPRPAMELGFLSHKFIDYGGYILPVPERSRILSSLYYGSDLDQIAWHYLRANALRIECWPDKQTRQDVTDYISFLVREYPVEMRRSVTLSGFSGDIRISNKQILSSWKTDEWIFSLYTGCENAGESVTRVRTCINKSHLSRVNAWCEEIEESLVENQEEERQTSQ